MTACTLCGGDSHVTDSRPHDGNTVKRNRQCDNCGSRFTTLEMVAEGRPLMPVASSEDFKRARAMDKIVNAVAALQKDLGK